MAPRERDTGQKRFPVPHSSTNGSPSANNPLAMITLTRPIERRGVHNSLHIVSGAGMVRAHRADLAMERALQIFAAINFLAMGLSHVVQHRAWKEFFVFLHARGTTGNFINAFLSLGMGSLIIAFHRVWTGIPLLLTLYGLASLAKGVLFLVAPTVGLRSMENATEKDSRLFIVPGVLLITLGAALLYNLV